MRYISAFPHRSHSIFSSALGQFAVPADRTGVTRRSSVSLGCSGMRDYRTHDQRLRGNTFHT
jgi:hypothetical protein